MDKKIKVLVWVMVLGVCTMVYGKGKVSEPGYLGTVVSANKDGKGVVVMTVERNSPAKTAGLETNDVIYMINNKTLDGVESFREIMSKATAGQKIIIKFIRAGATKDIKNAYSKTVVLSEVPISILKQKAKDRLGLSLKEKAEQAMQEEKYSEAIPLFQRWLEAEPQDKNSWYNLACSYGMVGQKEKALEAWENSVDAGFDYIDLPLKDSSFKSLWGEERFKKAYARCLKMQGGDTIANCKRHTAEMVSLGTYIVLLPPDYGKTKKSYPLCLILHGSGSTEIGHGKLADIIGREGVIYVVPRYPYAHTDIFFNSKKEGWTAWPPFDIKGDSVFRALDSLNVEWILKCAEEAKKNYRISGDKVFILGHSQGAISSNLCAIFHPERVKSYFAYAGELHRNYLKEENFKRAKESGIKAYLVHGTEDKTIDSSEARKVADVMSKSGVKYELKFFKAPHIFTDEVLEYAKEWVRKEVFGK
ncbi:MAG: PDZ domain-containing protein [bacterium]|nr:PDZ domain-containing protein [bacterium]